MNDLFMLIAIVVFAANFVTLRQGVQDIVKELKDLNRKLLDEK